MGASRIANTLWRGKTSVMVRDQSSVAHVSSEEIVRHSPALTAPAIAAGEGSARGSQPRGPAAGGSFIAQQRLRMCSTCIEKGVDRK